MHENYKPYHGFDRHFDLCAKRKEFDDDGDMHLHTAHIEYCFTVVYDSSWIEIGSTSACQGFRHHWISLSVHDFDFTHTTNPTRFGDDVSWRLTTLKGCGRGLRFSVLVQEDLKV